ncbi:MAG: VCBS repeat-containing protein [Deltaproteobacteria bacterium]|nr:VCBS repeat-containing protein [Deltaproteobacteria bacterium]
MENTIVSGSKRTFRVTLFGVAMLVFGGTALAATAPDVKPLSFTYTAKDANGNTVTLENKITTGYEANRVAVDGRGNVYVTDAVSNTVNVFNTNGRLVRQININRPDAIGIDDQNDRIYISGAVDGRLRSIWTFDKNGDGKGPLSQFPWGTPSAITVGSSGDVYVADGDLNLVRRLSARGESEKKVYGPFGGERYAKEQYLQSNVVVDVYRTRRRMVAPQGVAVDEAKGLLYVAVMEVTEYLDKNCLTTTLTVDGTTASDSACYVDNENSWGYYANLTELTGLGKTTDSSYKYWNPVPYTIPVSPTPPPIQYLILVIDINKDNNDVNNNGYIEKTELKKIMTINSLDPYGTDPTFYYPWQPKGIALDGNGRLYIAAYTSDASSRSSTFGTFSGGLKVYDVDYDANGLIKGTALTPSGSFASGVYVDVVYSPNLNANGTPATGGRLFAATGGDKTVSSYRIDGGVNPANTEPAAPVLYDPDPAKSDVVIPTKKPTLKIVNATDLENDPLTYAYEVYEINKNTKIKTGNPITPPSMFAGGKENVGTEDNPIYITSMAISSDLKENSLYSWKARSFDGEYDAWSEMEGTFCIDAENENPTVPVIQKPSDGAAAPPLTTYLEWSRSEDPDCYGTVSYYTVEISGDAAFGTIPFSTLSNGPSVRLSDIAGLTNGMVYHWRVKAVDANGGVSYSSGRSFVYNYKTGTAGFGSNQPGTKVYIDGNYGYYGRFLGETPMEDVGGIAMGRHFVTFIKDGYEPYYAIVDVKDPAQGATEPVMAAMVPSSRIKAPAAGGTIKDSNGGDITAVSSSTPFVADYNNDGVKDLLVGGGDGKVYLYISEAADGSIVPLRFKGAIQAYDSITNTSSDINVASNAVPFVADYNNDGRKDLLIGSSDGYTYLCLNIGEDSAPVFALPVAIQDKDGSDIKAISNSAPAVVDYNNDGKKDLVVGSSDGTLRLYVNAGSDGSPEFGLPVGIKADGRDLDVGSNSRAFFTDWNSDGKKDLVVGRGIADSERNTVSLFFNVGTDDAPEFRSISGLPQWIKEKKKERGNRDYIKYLGYNQDIGDLAGGSGEASPFVVDWDGTSARDIIVGNGSGGVAAYVTE